MNICAEKMAHPPCAQNGWAPPAGFRLPRGLVSIGPSGAARRRRRADRTAATATAVIPLDGYCTEALPPPPPLHGQCRLLCVNTSHCRHPADLHGYARTRWVGGRHTTCRADPLTCRVRPCTGAQRGLERPRLMHPLSPSRPLHPTSPRAGLGGGRAPRLVVPRNVYPAEPPRCQDVMQPPRPRLPCKTRRCPPSQHRDAPAPAPRPHRRVRPATAPCCRPTAPPLPPAAGAFGPPPPSLQPGAAAQGANRAAVAVAAAGTLRPHPTPAPRPPTTPSGGPRR